MNTWENCVAWKQMINDTEAGLKKKVVLTHDGLCYDDTAEAVGVSNQITEASMETINRAVDDIKKRYERCAPYGKKKTNSYTGKRHLEEEDGYYLTNGEFILAVFCSGVLGVYWRWSKGAVGNMKKMNPNILFPMRLKKVG